MSRYVEGERTSSPYRRASTHTFATLEVPRVSYEFVRAQLIAGGYEHAIGHDSDDQEVIDMTGIALVAPPKRKWFWQR